MFYSFIHCMKTDSSSESLRTPSYSGNKDISRKRLFSTRLNEFQLSELKKRYKMDPYIKGVEKECMARNLGISPTRIELWFSQRRRKERKKRRQDWFMSTAWNLYMCACLWKFYYYIGIYTSYVCIIYLLYIYIYTTWFRNTRNLKYACKQKFLSLLYKCSYAFYM